MAPDGCLGLERNLGGLFSDALADQLVHVGEGGHAEARFPLATDQQAIQFRAGDDAQAQGEPLRRALLDISDDLH
ncbi:hypothetical protein D3C78_1759580 [compost metagenome]